jgi:hypothetical protein
VEIIVLKLLKLLKGSGDPLLGDYQRNMLRGAETLPALADGEDVGSNWGHASIPQVNGHLGDVLVHGVDLRNRAD